MCATLGPMRVKAGIQAGEAQEQQSFLDHFRELRRIRPEATRKGSCELYLLGKGFHQ